MPRSHSHRVRRAACTIVFLAMGIWGTARGARGEGFDWHNLGGQNWLTPARGQHYGDCHVFATFSMVESKYKLTRNDPAFSPDLSEWNFCHGMVDLGYWPGVNYFTSYGVVSETECPYDPVGVWCEGGWPLASGWENRVWKTVNNNYALADGTTAGLKNFVKANGPSFLRLQTANDLFDTVSSMYSNTRSPYNGPTNHWMALVGFQDDPNVPSGGYWILKNSWGTSWGSSGYGYIPYGFLEAHFNPEAPDTGLSFSSPVYYNGSMVSADWNGGAGTWNNGGGNWTKTAVNGVAVTPAAYAWENKETSATFGGTGGAVAISGTAIAHGITVNSAGYTFTGGALTVTAGGIAINESATIDSPLTVGGPQTWTVASGKTLTLNGALHTVVSNTTIAGAGSVTIAGAIDGGGILNTYGAKPGGIVKSSSGSLTLTGASNFTGDITVSTGTLYITPAGGANAAYSGAWFGGGGTVINSTGVTSIGGGASSYSGAISLQGSGTLQFVPAEGIKGTFSGIISGASPVKQNGPGTTVLSAYNTYTGDTIISNGVLQAITSASGRGLPTNSFLRLDGGVLQNNNSTTTFTRGLGTSGNAFQWTANGGGFSAYGRAFTIRVGGGTSTLAWGDNVGAQIVGTLKFGSKSATHYTSFQNGIDLNGADRTIDVDNNPNSTGDYAEITGVISGAAGIVKTGDGNLYLPAANAYTGTTTIRGGKIEAVIGAGIPAGSFISLDGGVFASHGAYTFTRGLGTSGNAFQWTANGGGFAAATGAMTVRINNGTDTLTWGNAVGSQIVGTLKLSSNDALYATTFENGIDLGGGSRIIQVDDSSYGSGDYAVLTGVISGTGSLNKTGAGRLVIAGAAGNTYAGSTIVKGGTLELNKTSGYAIPGNLILDGGESCFVKLVGANQFPPSASLTWINSKAYSFQEIELLGHSQTVASISDVGGRGVIENTWDESGYGDAALTVNNSANCSFNGYLRDTAYGSGKLALVKGGGATLTLSGFNISYTGGTTINAGKLSLYDVFNSAFLASGIVNNATLEFNTFIQETDFSGVIAGSGALLKIGDSNLILSGSSGNTYTGTTTLSAGTMHLNKSAGAAVPGNFVFSGSSNTYLYLDRSQQIASTATVIFNNSAGYGHLLLYGNNQTVAGIVCSSVRGVIENVQDQSGVSNTGTLTVNNAADCLFSGYTRDKSGGSSTGKLALVKSGAGTLTLSGPYIGHTGGTTVSGGKLVLLNTNNAAFATTNFTNNATLEINASSTAVSLGGVISGTGTLNKTGSYALTLYGDAVNTYTGTTNVMGGQLNLNKTYGSAVPGNLAFSGTANAYVYLYRAAQINAAADVSFGNTAGYGTLVLQGYNLTVAGIACANGLGVIENTHSESGVASTATLTVNNSADRSFTGILRDRYSGSSTGKLAIVKSGPGTLTLAGPSSGGYTGGLTVAAGTLDYSGGALPNCRYAVSGGTLNIGTRSQSIGLFQISGGVVAGSGTLTSNVEYDLRGGIVEAVLGGSAGLAKTQDTVALLKGPNAYSGTTRILAGTLALTAGGQISTLSTIDNTATLLIDDGAHALGNIGSAGSLLVGDAATLTATSIVQGSLTIGGDYSAIISAAAQANLAGTAVPEPGTGMLLASLCIALAAVLRKRRISHG